MMEKHGRIAFITTPRFRAEMPELVARFVYESFYSLCSAFEVVSTRGTYDYVMRLIRRPFDEATVSLIGENIGFPISTEEDLFRWQTTIQNALIPQLPSVQGMIELAYELVGGKLDAVIHLTEWDDVTSKADSMVIRREANVHNVPIASDIYTARRAVQTWKSLLAERDKKVFRKREKSNDPLEGLKSTHRILAIIAHDGMKLEACRFAVQYAENIFKKFDYILTTGTTGSWLKKFMLALNYSEQDVERIRCCQSGQSGGDVQIAYAVVKRLCHKVIFFQDPFISHPHETDIRLFEQAVLSKDVEVELATNTDSAKVILGV